MHPIERLRYVARASGDGPSLLVREAAGALASFSDDPAALVTACRRLVDRQPHNAPIWWLASRVLAATDPGHESWIAADELEEDPTPSVLRHELPADATVLILGWPEQVATAVARRGDLTVMVVDALGDGNGLVRRLERSGSEPVLVEERGAAAAAAAADLVVLEAFGLGASGIMAVTGSRAAATVARSTGVPVWVAAGVGRVLPGRLWDAYLRRLDDEGDPWDLDQELVPLEFIDVVVGPAGASTAAEAARRADCPIVAELLKSL